MSSPPTDEMGRNRGQPATGGYWTKSPKKMICTPPKGRSFEWACFNRESSFDSMNVLIIETSSIIMNLVCRKFCRSLATWVRGTVRSLLVFCVSLHSDDNVQPLTLDAAVPVYAAVRIQCGFVQWTKKCWIAFITCDLPVPPGPPIYARSCCVEEDLSSSLSRVCPTFRNANSCSLLSVNLLDMVSKVESVNVACICLFLTLGSTCSRAFCRCKLIDFCKCFVVFERSRRWPRLQRSNLLVGVRELGLFTTKAPTFCKALSAPIAKTPSAVCGDGLGMGKSDDSPRNDEPVGAKTFS
jgi:hypothetical protein